MERLNTALACSGVIALLAGGQMGKTAIHDETEAIRAQTAEDIYHTQGNAQQTAYFEARATHYEDDLDGILPPLILTLGSAAAIGGVLVTPTMRRRARH
jgi:hypothetical protein